MTFHRDPDAARTKLVKLPPPDKNGRRFFVPIIHQGESEMTQQATCPECEACLSLPADAMENELIACPDCGADLEILSLNPLEIGLAPEVEEDWGE